jgi:hypothetical protein
VVHAVRDELRNACQTEKRPDWYEIFATAFHEDSGTEPVSQQALAAPFGKTRDEVRGILDRLKKRCRRLLRNELRDRGGGGADIEAEADELLRLLAL